MINFVYQTPIYMAANTFNNKIRISAVKSRTQTFDPQTGLWVKRDSSTGLFMDVKKDGGKFKGIRKESLEKMSHTLNKLARYDKEK